MKLYRIVPDTFNMFPDNMSEKSILGNLNFYNLEELYYQLGYTSFYKNKNLESYITKCYSNSFSVYKGKFFFLFPESALITCKQIVSSKSLLCGNYILLEYDFPIELITNYIGCGYYELESFFRKQLLEFFIPMSEFGKSVFNELSSISENDKIKIFYDTLKNSYKYIKDIQQKISLNKKTNFGINIGLLVEILDKYETLLSKKCFQREVENSILYQTFMINSEGLVQCPFITKNIAIISELDIHMLRNKFVSIEELLITKGFTINGIARYNERYESELLNEVYLRERKDKEKVMSLLNKLIY